MAEQPNLYQRKDLVSTWDAVSAQYDETTYWRMPENHANLETILHHIGDPTDKRIIEIGCGSGFTTLALARRGARCALLDTSAVALETSAAGFVRAGLPEPKRYLQDALNNTLPSDTFDLVWNGGVIEHFTDEGKRKLMQEMVRICAPGGHVLILVPNRLALQFQLRQVWQKLRGTWIYGFEDDMSPGRLLRMARELNFHNSEAYAFNPVAAWRWLPHTTKILRWLRVDTLEHHMRRSRTGMVSILIIKK